jgi:hypothetical protein
LLSCERVAETLETPPLPKKLPRAVVARLLGRKHET